VWATGYRVTIPFLSEHYLGTDAEAMPLFHRVFHLDDPSLMFTGLMQSTGAALPVVEAQGKLVAAWVSGRYSLPAPDAQLEAVQRALEAAVDRWGTAKRPMMRIDFDAYLADTTREIARGRTRARRGGDRFTGSGLATAAPASVSAQPALSASRA